jgi:hypothetical protein
MSLTWKKTADVDTSSTIKAAKQARKASSAAAANASSAAQNAASAAQNAANLAAAATASAAQNASGAAQTAAAGVTKGVKQGVYSARSWAGPRLDSAAEYCTTTVAPKVSAALHSTARQVTPPEAKSSKRSVVTWSLLGAAILAALGAAAAAARYRYRAAIEADSEAADEEVLADSAGSQAAPNSPEGTRPTAEKPKGQDAETSVNGQVTASGW